MNGLEMLISPIMHYEVLAGQIPMPNEQFYVKFSRCLKKVNNEVFSFWADQRIRHLKFPFHS